MNKTGSTKAKIVTRLAKYKMIDGLLILSHWPLSFKEVIDLEQMGFPYVTVDDSISGVKTNRVEVDNFGGALRAVQYPRISPS